MNLRDYLTKDNLRYETIFGNLNAFGLLNLNLGSFVKYRFTRYFEQCYPQTPVCTRQIGNVKKDGTYKSKIR